MTPTNVLEAHNLGKRFGSVRALENVSFAVGEAEAFGLIGDNGAGKSTLLKILSGVFPPDEGEMRLEGQPVRFRAPLDARKAGIEMIYQDLALCDDLDVVANIFLGREPRHRVLGPITFLDRKRMQREVQQVLGELGTTIPANRRVALLSGGERQLVAVARALEFQPRVMLLDEPTAALSADKIRVLLRLIEQLKSRGVSVILVSHRFTDIIHVCDRILVLRQGEVAGMLQVAGASGEHLSSEMLALMSGETEVGDA